MVQDELTNEQFEKIADKGEVNKILINQNYCSKIVENLKSTKYNIKYRASNLKWSENDVFNIIIN